LAREGAARSGCNEPARSGRGLLREFRAAVTAARAAGLRQTLKTCAGLIWSVHGFLLVASVAFWYLRITYWKQNYEAPISDIWGYVVTGDNIARSFFFGLDAAHPTYYTPVTPTFIAISKLIAPVAYERAFRFIVQIITFVAALGLVREIALMTGKKWLAAAFFAIVTLCRPSIFWSMKLSTEGVCEALLYATLATGLLTLRTRSLAAAAACGFFALCLGLNRPNFLLGTMLVPLAFLIGGYRRRAWPDDDVKNASDGKQPQGLLAAVSKRRMLLVAGVFAIAYLSTWSLWIGRNAIQYGAFIPTSSSSGQSVLWEYGGGPVKIGRYDSLTLADGSQFSDFGKVMQEAGRYPRDVEGAQRLYAIARAWYAANWMDLPRLFTWRLKHLIATRGASGLTVVPRETLFVSESPGYNKPFASAAWMELFLLDKTAPTCLIALVGIGLLLWSFPAPGFLFFALGLVPWLAAAAVIGYERTVESLITLTVWLSLYAIVSVASMLNGYENPSGLR
jgi:hypothetical protein